MCLYTQVMLERTTLLRMLILSLLIWLLTLQSQITLKLLQTFKKKWMQTKRQVILLTQHFKPTLTHFLRQ